jgi:hypothetical protein
MLSTVVAHKEVHSAHDPLALPIPAFIGDQFSLRNHVALESMKVGKGNAATAQALLEMVLAAGLLADYGHGRLDQRQARLAEKAIASATSEGLRSNSWKLSPEGFGPFVRLSTTTEHDFQLSHANSGDVLCVLRQVHELCLWASATASQIESHTCNHCELL